DRMESRGRVRRDVLAEVHSRRCLSPIRTRLWVAQRGHHKARCHPLLRGHRGLRPDDCCALRGLAPSAPTVPALLARDEVDPKLDPARYTLRSIERHLAGGE